MSHGEQELDISKAFLQLIKSGQLQRFLTTYLKFIQNFDGMVKFGAGFEFYV